MGDPIFQLTKEESDDLTERWGRAGEAKRLYGVESDSFKTLFNFYKEKMVELGIKYGYNPEDVIVTVIGGVYLKPLAGTPAKK